MKVLLVTNSDFGIRNTVGYRATPIAKRLNKNGLLKSVLCRDFKAGVIPQSKLRIVIPSGNIIPKILSGLELYITKRIDARSIQVMLFEFFSKKGINGADIMHNWEYSDVINARAKKRGMKVVQDVPIALRNIVKEINEREQMFPKENETISRKTIRAFKLADKIIAPSTFVKESLIKINIPSSRITVVPYGVDCEEFTPGKKRRKFTVSFAGNVSHRKGIKYLIKAWKSVCKKDMELR
ncbi:glycosyltransferase, partial [Nanoarchaeota archaeon]